MKPSEPTVFIVDDDQAMRDALSWLIQSVNLQVQTFASAEEFLGRYDQSLPGCLVLDVRMPGMSGLKLQEELAARGRALPIIMLTGYAEVPTAVRALKQGAIDFLNKPFSDALLLDRVAEAIEIDKQRRLAEQQRADVRARYEALTPRERDVMRLVIDGKANKVIASDLGLSPRTVEVHRASVMRKMSAESVADLVRSALLIDPPPTPR